MNEHNWDASCPQSGPPPSEGAEQASSETERLAYIDGIKAQIRKGVYRPDVRDLARSLASMLVRDL
jgi:anti-sigma28 factor (negative regulator of flagellin synthesis)